MNANDMMHILCLLDSMLLIMLVTPFISSVMTVRLVDGVLVCINGEWINGLLNGDST